WLVVVPARTDPIAVIPSIGSELMGRTWINEIHTWDAPYPGDDGVSLLSKVLTALLPETSSVGTAKGLETHLRMPLADFEAVQAIVAPRAFVDATDVIQRCREIKSEAEIEKIRSTCQIADRAFARVPDIAQSGKPLDAVFRDFQIALLEEGADWVSYVAGASDTNGYADVISPAQATPLALGDVLM
ncbi:MAG: aminopeptidase P family protein, partial [Boseongicola sp.]|nr:aminopeptidase P family protein [Boseongicola sp.]